jgi:hypothetical protein
MSSATCGRASFSTGRLAPCIVVEGQSLVLESDDRFFLLEGERRVKNTTQARSIAPIMEPATMPLMIGVEIPVDLRGGSSGVNVADIVDEGVVGVDVEDAVLKQHVRRTSSTGNCGCLMCIG